MNNLHDNNDHSFNMTTNRNKYLKINSGNTKLYLFNYIFNPCILILYFKKMFRYVQNLYLEKGWKILEILFKIPKINLQFQEIWNKIHSCKDPTVSCCRFMLHVYLQFQSFCFGHLSFWNHLCHLPFKKKWYQPPNYIELCWNNVAYQHSAP